MKKKEILCQSLWIQLTLVSVMSMFVYNAFIYAEDAEAWIPDPNLRKAVRHQLELDADIELDVDTPLTKADMLKLYRLTPFRFEIEAISDLTGLEYAINIYSLLLPNHRVKDLRPIVDLTNLRFLGFGKGPISDITPLSGLVNLETLTLSNNQIVDISPLLNLINLRVLKLARNQIEDFSPLTELVNLEWLEIQRNRSSDISEIPIAKLTKFVYDETCVVPRLPFADRIADRKYPSIFGVYSYVPNKPPVILRPETSEIKPNAYFDLNIGGLKRLRLGWYLVNPVTTKLSG